MPNTYSQIYIQIVFAVEGRQNLISPRHREELHKYIAGIVSNRKQKLIAIFCMPDHIHMLVGISPAIAISDLVRDIKAGSSNFINEKKWVRGGSTGRRGSGYSLTHGVRSARSAITSSNRKVVMKGERSEMNTLAS